MIYNHRYLDLANEYTFHSRNCEFAALSPCGKYLATLNYEQNTLFIQLYEMKDDSYSFLDGTLLMENLQSLEDSAILFSLNSAYLIIQVSINGEEEEENVLIIFQTLCLEKQLRTTLQNRIDFIRLSNNFLIYIIDDQKSTNQKFIIQNLINGAQHIISLLNQLNILNTVGWFSDQLYFLEQSIQNRKLTQISINYQKNSKTCLTKIVNRLDSVYSGIYKIAIYNSGQYKIFTTNNLKQIRSISLAEDYSQNIRMDKEIYLYSGQINSCEVKIIHCLNYKEFTLKNSAEIYGNIQQFVKPALFLQVSDEAKIKIFLYK